MNGCERRRWRRTNAGWTARGNERRRVVLLYRTRDDLSLCVAANSRCRVSACGVTVLRQTNRHLKRVTDKRQRCTISSLLFAAPSNCPVADGKSCNKMARYLRVRVPLCTSHHKNKTSWTCPTRASIGRMNRQSVPSSRLYGNEQMAFYATVKSSTIDRCVAGLWQPTTDAIQGRFHLKRWSFQR